MAQRIRLFWVEVRADKVDEAAELADVRSSALPFNDIPRAVAHGDAALWVGRPRDLEQAPSPLRAPLR